MSATLSGKALISSDLAELAERRPLARTVTGIVLLPRFANREPVDLTRTSGSDEHDATVKAARAFTTSETPERDFAPAEPSQKPS